MPFSRDLSPRGLFAVYTAFRSSSNIRICRSAGRFALSHAHPGFDFAGSVLLAGSRKGIFEAFVEFTVQFLVGPHRLLWIHSVLVGRCGVKLISHMMSSFRETNAVRRGWVPEPEEQMQSANVVVGLREPYASSIKIQLPTRCERIRPVARHSGERSLAPGWRWQPAFEVRELQEVMMPLCCHCLELGRQLGAAIVELDKFRASVTLGGGCEERPLTG